jgi:hypothetical protein
MTGLSSAPKISDIVDILEATKTERKNITQIDLVIDIVREMVWRGAVNVNRIVMITKTDDENIEASHAIVLMKINLAGKNDVVVEVDQKNQIKNSNLEYLL